jgi:leucyl-tRNA synthetase
MKTEYNASESEAKWQKQWDEAELYKTDLAKAKNPFYSLVMFPYPSGDKLHVGHWYNYAPADSYARFKRMTGSDVFSPMGFDAFGLPAENYAIKTGVKPAESTAKNIKTMIEQLKRIGCMYDWSRMVNTTDPSYYRWTQWLFLEMYKNGLAYKKKRERELLPQRPDRACSSANSSTFSIFAPASAAIALMPLSVSVSDNRCANN